MAPFGSGSDKREDKAKYLGMYCDAMISTMRALVWEEGVSAYRRDRINTTDHIVPHSTVLHRPAHL